MSEKWIKCHGGELININNVTEFYKRDDQIVAFFNTSTHDEQSFVVVAKGDEESINLAMEKIEKSINIVFDAGDV